MVSQSSQIIEIDLINFISTKVRNIDYMFSGDTSLKSIKFGNFKISGVFRGCSSLESLDLSSFDTYSVTDFQSIFCYHRSLNSLELTRNFQKLAGSQRGSKFLKRGIEKCQILLKVPTLIKINNLINFSRWIP